MKTIQFSEDVEEEGLRVIILNGLVEYTEYKEVYRVPIYILKLLDEKQIPYEILKNEEQISKECTPITF